MKVNRTNLIRTARTVLLAAAFLGMMAGLLLAPRSGRATGQEARPRQTSPAKPTPTPTPAATTNQSSPNRTTSPTPTQTPAAIDRNAPKLGEAPPPPRLKPKPTPTPGPVEI